MRQIAFFADIHANLPALRAVMEDIRGRGVEEVYFLGDMVGKGPSGAQVVDLIRGFCTEAVYGNWDRLVSGNYQGYGGPVVQGPAARGPAGLPARPAQGPAAGGGGPAGAGLPWPLHHPHVVLPYDGRKSVQQAQEAVGEADVTIMADSHHPFLVMNEGKMLVNTGSAGNPCDKVPKCSYFLLREEGTRLEAAHVRLDYDVEEAVRLALAAEGLPMQEEYVQELRRGVYMRFKPR